MMFKRTGTPLSCNNNLLETNRSQDDRMQSQRGEGGRMVEVGLVFVCRWLMVTSDHLILDNPRSSFVWGNREGRREARSAAEPETAHLRIRGCRSICPLGRIRFPQTSAVFCWLDGAAANFVSLDCLRKLQIIFLFLTSRRWLIDGCSYRTLFGKVASV